MEPERPDRGDAPSMVDLGIEVAKVGVRFGFATGSLMLGLTGRVVRGALDGLVADREPAALPAAPEAPPDLGHKLGSLLDRSVAQSSHDGREELFHRMVDRMVPDEARFIGALSDGTKMAVINVYERGLAGGQGAPLLLHACAVGKEANLALPRLTPTYLEHLISMGLVSLGPEVASLAQQYEVLGADIDVLRAVKAGSRGPVPAVVERRSARLTDLGRDLWTTAMAR